MYESTSEYLLFFINNLNNANVLLRILENDIYCEEAVKFRIDFKSNKNLGIFYLRADNRRFDLDHNLENIVYNELLYMGYTLRYMTTTAKSPGKK
jgi:hypothetical protein